MVHRPVVVEVARAVSVTVVVPTYLERENLGVLLRRLAAVRDGLDGAMDVVFMDDPSGDGSGDVVAAFAREHGGWARLVTRTGPRGLSAAVLDGFAEARGDVVVVMDADLSHPPEAIPAMLERLAAGAEMVVGSRYVEGGSTDDKWGVLRWVNSAAATLLARPLTRVRDPMSGFFAVRRGAVLSARGLNPIGYKVLLELIVKCGLTRVEEVPIRFGLRHAGESKLSFTEQVKYVRHLGRLYGFVMGRRRRD